MPNSTTPFASSARSSDTSSPTARATSIASSATSTVSCRRDSSISSLAMPASNVARVPLGPSGSNSSASRRVSAAAALRPRPNCWRATSSSSCAVRTGSLSPSSVIAARR